MCFTNLLYIAIMIYIMCSCISACVWMILCVYACVRVCEGVCVCVCVRVCVCVCVHVHVCALYYHCNLCILVWVLVSVCVMERAKHSFLLCPIPLSCLVINKICLNKVVMMINILLQLWHAFWWNGFFLTPVVHTRSSKLQYYFPLTQQNSA